MYQTGLVSISFRKHSVEEIIQEVRRCGLTQIEWGTDVHVPAGDLARARYVRELMDKNGLTTSSYGSYYRLGTGDDFVPYIKSALALGAPIIRIWGGTRGSNQLSIQDLKNLAMEGRTLAEMAAEHGLTVALECHANTLTDHFQVALDFLQMVDHPAMKMYWQPNQYRSYEYNLTAAQELSPYVTHIHVFSWEVHDGQVIRYPLVHHKDRWKQYLSLLPGDHALLLEFMHDDRIESLEETAKMLNDWI